MAKQHSTLNPSVNGILVIVWGLFAAIFTYVSHPLGYPIVALAIILGAIGGMMQWLALNEGRIQFVQAKTMLEIRAIMKKTAWGKRYLIFLWCGFLLMMIGSFALRTGNPFALFFSGYFTQMFARDLVTLKPTFELAKIIKP